MAAPAHIAGSDDECNCAGGVQGMLTAAAGCIAGSTALAGCFYALPMMLRRLEERALRAWCARTRTLVLTYDDGPGPASTPPLLDLLAAHRVTATFFITGFRAAEHSDLVDRIAGAGHEIGCHSHAHLHAWRSAPWRAAADADRGYRSLGRWVAPGGLFRPPYGKCDAWTRWQLKRAGAPLAWWTVDSGDADDDLPGCSPAPGQLLRDGGGIVLMHDFDREPCRIHFMLETTEQLLKLARSEKWNVRTFGELWKERPPAHRDLRECPAAG